MKFTLTGVVPSKKNSRQWIVRGGRKFLVPSAGHAAWHKDASIQLRQQKVTPILGQVEIHMAFYLKTKHRKDLDNMVTSILDLLKDFNVIEDDDYRYVVGISARFMGHDKKNPRTEVSIVSV